MTRCLLFFFNLRNYGFCSHSVIFLSDRQVSEWKSLTRVQLFETPWAIQSMDFLGQNTEVGSLSLLQGILPTRDQTGVPCIAGRFFTHCTIWEAHYGFHDNALFACSFSFLWRCSQSNCLIGLCPPIMFLGSCNAPSHTGDSRSQLSSRGHGPWDSSAADTAAMGRSSSSLFHAICHQSTPRFSINLHWILSLTKIFVICSPSCDWLFCSSMYCSLPGSSVRRILQARILEWVAISFSRGIFPTQGSNPHLLLCRQILDRWTTREAQLRYLTEHKFLLVEGRKQKIKWVF